MPASVASAPVNRTSAKSAASRPKKAASTAGKKTQSTANGAANGIQHASPYTIMASRIANRVAEMAENMTFVERERYVCSRYLVPCLSLVAVEIQRCATNVRDVIDMPVHAVGV